jgi:ElaB/YqjD/DUF883 family membrane-anchored ribosome-binding protein
MRNKRIISDEIERARSSLEHDVETLEGMFRAKVETVKHARAKVEELPPRIAADPWRAVGVAFALGVLIAWVRE